MKLIDIFETQAQEQVHHNPSVGTLKALARNNKYHSARFVITKDGDVVAADSELYTHHSMAPYDGAWDVRGYVQYMGDGEYAYRSMAVYSALNKDHPILRIWERAGIQNGNPDQSHLAEVIKATVYPGPDEVGATITAPQRTPEPVVQLPVAKISKLEPVEKFDLPVHAANLKRIMLAIKQGKKLPPILVRRTPDGYQVVDGHHRLRAHELLNKHHIAARVISPRNIEVAEAWSKSYKQSINCNSPRGFSQRAHCAGRKARQAHKKTRSQSVSESVQSAEHYNNWIRYTPESLQADWSEYTHKAESKWHHRADLIGARWPLFTHMRQFKQALDTAPIVNIDDLVDVENLTKNHSLESIKAMVGGYNNPRDVDRIVMGLHAHVPLPLPIILKGSKGMWIQAGNTRQSVSRVLGVTPRALLVDVSD